MKGIHRCLLAIAFLFFWLSSAYGATAALADRYVLSKLLRSMLTCQVIDARSPGNVKRQPIDSGELYKSDMVIKRGMVVVVADSDRQALEVAKVLSKWSGQDIYAVKGGYETWKQVQKETAKPPAGAESIMPPSFVIPSDTCQQGPPLHEFKK